MKQLQLSASEEDRVKFLQEAAIMGQFFHPNVVKLHGVVTKEDPVRERGREGGRKGGRVGGRERGVEGGREGERGREGGK